MILPILWRAVGDIFLKDNFTVFVRINLLFYLPLSVSQLDIEGIPSFLLLEKIRYDIHFTSILTTSNSFGLVFGNIISCSASTMYWWVATTKKSIYRCPFSSIFQTFVRDHTWEFPFIYFIIRYVSNRTLSWAITTYCNYSS